jgi:hypothetical protein
MANRNFAQFTQLGAPNNRISTSDVWVVGRSEGLGTEIQARIGDLFTYFSPTTGIAISFGGANNTGFGDGNFTTGNSNFFYNDPRLTASERNGYTFHNIVVGSGNALSGQGGLIFGNSNTYFSGTEQANYVSRFQNLILGNSISLSADFKYKGGNYFGGAANTLSFLSRKGTLLQSPNLYCFGTDCRVTFLSSETPYTGQLTNGSQQLSAYYPQAADPTIIQYGCGNDISSTAQGGYVNNLGPAQQYAGIVQIGWGSRIYGAMGGVGQFCTAASTISGMSINSFQFGGYGNTFHECDGAFQFGGNNNYINTAGNCGHGGTVNIGFNNYIGNITHRQPSGNVQRIQNTCGSLLNIGQFNRLSIDGGFNFGDYNNIAGYQILNFGNYNKIGICNFNNNGSDNKFGGASFQYVIGNNNCIYFV